MSLLKRKPPPRRQVEMRLVNKRLWKRGVISNRCNICGMRLICPCCAKFLPKWKEKGL